MPLPHPNPGPLRFGANYVPSSGWFYGWLDQPADAARRDFEDLAGIGLDHVRVFPVWPWIQPNRTLIRRRGIDDLLAVIDAAAEFGLSVAVDLLQGHLSSFDFLPSWVLTWHRRGLFTDPDVRAGLVTYVDTLTREIATRDNVFAVTLGNEVNNLYPANPTTFGDSRNWAAELLGTARAAAPGLLTLHSLYDATWYDPEHPFHPADNVDLGDLTTVHSWVFNGVSAIDGPLGPATVTHADYLVELAAATSPDPCRPVWLQEVGVPRPDVPEPDAPAFVSRLLEAVTPNPALWGVTWWCSHDLDRSLADFPEREYDLGLFTVDHQPKPAARELAAAVKERRDRAARRRALVCDVDLRAEPERRAEVAPGSAFHAAWVRLRQDGPLAIVTAARAADPADLAARGIDTVLDRH
ncbi:glycosyl hydrolase [Nonomuraea sp. KC401]|uniref:glycoside hydrolase 5 family protein n=1 Tax=unclassified Nonomuraea TaxID=2593643 RepID=UPI0010FDDAA2|nr:glycosyl hydrolase [Nonomuraea sp. KC401]NBE93480.1 glycosyl hydrolase [Nonomuraea sp. K271]TLF81419.1 glycosyl hydrolase [Nonomuraea sp. KC401]